MTEPIEQFRSAIVGAGITAPDVIEADGKLHRFASNGKNGDDSGWYVLHCDGVAAGIFGDWRSGIQSTWKDDRRKLSREDAAAQKAMLAAFRKQRDEAERLGHAEASKRAVAIWTAAIPATAEHGYLLRKGIGPHGTRVVQSGNCAGWLAVPMHDTAGNVWNIERIAPTKPDGGGNDKKGLYQARRTGLHYIIGDLTGAAVLCIAEGFSTGASIHEATGLPVAVAFNAGNLEAAAKALRKAHPDRPLLICADDDWKTVVNGEQRNVGRLAAEAAAKAVGAALVFPVFPGERGDKDTDFNDMGQATGPESVRRIVVDAADSLTGQADADGKDDDEIPTPGVSDTAATESGEDGGNPCPFPGEDGRPTYIVLDDWQEWKGRKFRPGVYYCGMTAEKKDTPAMPFETRFCSPLHIDALTFDAQDGSYGRLLRIKNSRGRWKTWAMPMELLRGAGDELRGELLGMGVELDPAKARTYLPAYLQWRTPERRMHCAMQVGWAGKSFVLPDQVIGPDSASVVFQSGEHQAKEHTTAGTLEGWQEGIAAKASGNPLLMLALSAGFAGPMLAQCNAEGGGIHFVGDSSTGKTTAIEAACSIWGGPNYRRSWRATANGIEGAAALFNDCLLALDEISECDPRQVGETIYMLGNGRGKQRASRSGTARGVVRWRCMVLSSGERSIGTTMADGGHRIKAGQSVRLLDLPVSRTHGAWDVLHGAASAAAFSDAIKRTAAQHHGHVGRAFLEKLTHDTTDFCTMLETAKALPMFSADGGEGQDKRAAGRFALIGLSGELATDYGLTGWLSGDALGAAATAFALWRSLRGKGNDERRQIAEKLAGYIERYGDGRFSDVDGTGETRINDRAGWWRGSHEGREYLLTAEAMREALKGFDFNRALDVLQELGALPKPGSDGKRARFIRIGGRGVKLYPINPDKLAGGEHGA